MHNVAFDELHDSTEVPPVMTAFGLAARAAVGTTLTVTIAALLVPPGPVQVSEYVVPVVILLLSGFAYSMYLAQATNGFQSNPDMNVMDAVLRPVFTNFMRFLLLIFMRSLLVAVKAANVVSSLISPPTYSAL